MRKSFHDELDGLRSQVLEMGKLTLTAISESVRSLVEADSALAGKVIEGDERLDRMNLSVEERCLSVMATQCPVAGDLRLVHTLIFIAAHFERMGDLSVNIAKMAQRTHAEPGTPELRELILKMGDQAGYLVAESLRAFEHDDARLAATLPTLDEPVDQLFKSFFKLMVKSANDEAELEWAANIVLCSRYLERIADHAVDIGERINYMVTGKPAEWD